MEDKCKHSFKFVDHYRSKECIKCGLTMTFDAWLHREKLKAEESKKSINALIEQAKKVFPKMNVEKIE